MAYNKVTYEVKIDMIRKLNDQLKEYSLRYENGGFTSSEYDIFIELLENKVKNFKLHKKMVDDLKNKKVRDEPKDK